MIAFNIPYSDKKTDIEKLNCYCFKKESWPSLCLGTNVRKVEKRTSEGKKRFTNRYYLRGFSMQFLAKLFNWLIDNHRNKKQTCNNSIISFKFAH